MKKKYLIFALFTILFVHSTQTLAQNWFPMEVGNRWDFIKTTYTHGGNWSTDTVSIEIVSETNFGQDKNYFVFSPFSIFSHKYIRLERDSLYSYNIEDSTECLLLAFNQDIGSFYSGSCHWDSIFYSGRTNWNYFGLSDSQQAHIASWYSYEISKKFGFVSSDYGGAIFEVWYNVSGCIISGVSYGKLLVSVEKFEETVNRYTLFQNYPNPFNPGTNIKFVIPKSSFVNLKVYNVLGKEVATLVNEEKPAASYEVEFEASSLPSGVYFYRLQVYATGHAGSPSASLPAGRQGSGQSFVETKKMILLR